MSKEFDNLVRRATCQMKVMLRERRRFRVLAQELETLAKKGIVDRQQQEREGLARTGPKTKSSQENRNEEDSQKQV